MRTPHPSRWHLVAATALAAPALLTGCGAGTGAGTGGDSGSTEVVTAFYPLAFVAERLAGEHATVENLTSAGVDPHDLELSVEQTAQIAEADLVVFEEGLQPAIDEAVALHGPEQTLEVTEVVDLEPLTDHDGEAHDGEAHDEAAQDEAEQPEADDGHDHGEADLHFWLDPARMVVLAEALHDRLVEIDPEHAEDYRANLGRLRADLEALDADYERGLSGCKIDTVVVSHDAFGYLEKYGLHFEPIAGLSPGAEPSAAHLAELGQLIRAQGVTTVFSERLASPALAQTLARELGVDTGVLDPIEGLTEETAGEDYLSLMRNNLEALRTAQRCR